MRPTFLFTLAIIVIACPRGASQAWDKVIAHGPRYPSDISLGPSGRYLFTANRASQSVSLLDVASGGVLHEYLLGGDSRPARLASFLLNGTLALALSDDTGGSVILFKVQEDRLELRITVTTPGSPQGLQYMPGLKKLLVACPGANTVRVLDPEKGVTLGNIGTVEGVRHLLPLPGDNQGKVVVAGRHSIGLIDIANHAKLGESAPAMGRALNLEGVASNGESIFLAHQVQPTQVAVDPQMIVWGLILANRVTAIPVSTLKQKPRPDKGTSKSPESKYIYGVGYEGGNPLHRVVPLDQRQRANGDPGKAALVPLDDSPGDLLLLPSGGTNRLLFIDTDQAYLPGTEPLSRQDPIPSIQVGGRPVAVVCDSLNARAFVLCSLEDAIWEIDIVSRAVTRKLPLGPAPEATPEHLGAKIFYNSKRSKGGWYSCNSCHPDGGTRGHTFDTHADGDGLAKKSPDLRGAAKTPPWGWNGKFKTLQEQVVASLHSTMAVNQGPSNEDVSNVVAFIGSLHSPPPGGGGLPLGGDPVKGSVIFQKAACASCHRPPLYTSPELKDVGVFDEYDGYRDFNPPSLLGVSSRVRYLHDGRAETLRSIFTVHDKEKKHGKAHGLSPTQLDDLVAFLRSL